MKILTTKNEVVEEFENIIDQCFKVELMTNSSLRKTYLEIREQLAERIYDSLAINEDVVRKIINKSDITKLVRAISCVDIIGMKK